MNMSVDTSESESEMHGEWRATGGVWRGLAAELRDVDSVIMN